jgi:hypothetical protein
MDPGTVLAIASIAIEGTEVVAKIVRLALEVKHFKPKCEALKNDCVLILEMSRQAGNAKVDLKTARRITDSLHMCLSFLSQCSQDWGLLRSSFEVVFRRKHESIKDELKWSTDLLIADTVVRLQIRGFYGFDERLNQCHRLDFLADRWKSLRKMPTSSTM